MKCVALFGANSDMAQNKQSSEAIKYANVPGLLRGTKLMARKLKCGTSFPVSDEEAGDRQAGAVPAALASPSSPRQSKWRQSGDSLIPHTVRDLIQLCPLEAVLSNLQGVHFRNDELQPLAVAELATRRLGVHSLC